MYIDHDAQDNLEKESFEQNFVVHGKEIKHQEMAFLLGCLRNHFVFYNLSDRQMEQVVRKMQYCTVESESMIFEKDSRAECFFVIQKGRVQVIGEDSAPKTLTIGNGFGETALLYRTPRQFSVRAIEWCELWMISRGQFRTAVEHVLLKEFEESKRFLEQTKFFSGLSNEHKDTVAGAVVVRRYAKGEVIVEEGDPGSTFYVIREGSASLWRNNKQMGHLGKGEGFGEQALYYNVVRQLTVRADEETVCLLLCRETLSRMLGNQLLVITFRNFMLCAIEGTAYLSKLSREKIDGILDCMNIKSYMTGNVVRKSSEPKLIIVIEGSLKKYKNINACVSPGQVYGEDSLLEAKYNEEEIVSESDGVVAEILSKEAMVIIGGCIDTIIKSEEKEKSEHMEAVLVRRMKKVEGLEEMVVLGALKEQILVAGQKREGKVYVIKVEIAESGTLCLTKMHSKHQLQADSTFKYVVQEKNLFKELYHPFIMQYYMGLEDQYYFYSIVQFIQGEEFYSAIRQIGILSSEDAQFYIASIVLLIEYLASQGVFLREIKPESFMVDERGYLKLIDLVSAKVTKGGTKLLKKTYTLFGTPHYIAPEIIIGKGYNYYVTFYSLGILLFELMCGYVPFGEGEEDPLEIYDQILNSQIKYSKQLTDLRAKKLMEQLLSRTDPESRMGSSFKDLKANSWFQSISWDALYQKKMDPPHFKRCLNVSSLKQLSTKIKNAKSCTSYLREERKKENKHVDLVFTLW